MRRYSKYLSLKFLLIFVLGFSNIMSKEYASFTISDIDTCLLGEKPDVSCLIVDFKYDEDSLKILEFGNLVLSSAKRYDHLYGQGVIWDRLWKHLETYNLPIWYTGGFVSSDKNDMAFNTFFNIGGKYKRDIRSLVIDNDFCKYSKNKTFVPGSEKIEDYKGIIVGDFYKKVKKCNKMFPGFILLNDAVYEYAKNKHQLDSLFEGELKKFRPICKSYSKVYSSQLVSQIENDFQCNNIVIKPIKNTMRL